MAVSGNSRSPIAVGSLAGAAIIALVLSLALPAGVATGQQHGIDRSVIPVAPDAPERYTVQQGDTLWNISARFLTDPWYWPEIWHINPQVANPHLIYPGDVLALTWVNGQPRLVLESGGPMRLSPRVRENPLSEAINAIPYDRIAAFMSRPDVLAREQVKSAPYVVHGRDDRLISATGNEVYVRRLGDPQRGGLYNIYHVGDELKDPDDGDVLGYQGLFTGQGSVIRGGDPATLQLVNSARETLEGDILLPERIEMKMDFIPRAPKANLEGTVMSVIDQRTVVVEHDIVIINRGTRDGLEPGNVLSTWAAGEKARDTTAYAVSSSVQLPNERTGLFMVFKTYDRMSYGLMLESAREIEIGDKVRSP